MADTYLNGLVDPEVMAGMIDAALPNAIRFAGVAPIDDTLAGQPGSSITVPKYAYIGDAKEVAEGAAIDYAQLTTSESKYTVKKVAKGVTLTDEAMLSGYGDPVGQATSQITMSIASKVDADIVEEALKAPLKVSAAIDLGVIDKVEAAFGDDYGECGVLFVSPSDAAKLREQAAGSWARASELGDSILVSGVLGEVLGWQIVRSGRLTAGTAIAVKAGALKTYLKRGVLAESARDIDHKMTKFNADQHYVVAIADDTKIVVVQPEAGK